MSAGFAVRGTCLPPAALPNEDEALPLALPGSESRAPSSSGGRS
jgi:hypothetical protein